MAMLHYGGTRTFDVPPEEVPALIKTIGAKASDGKSGWVSFTDDTGQDWSILVSPGIPIYIDVKGNRAKGAAPRRLA